MSVDLRLRARCTGPQSRRLGVSVGDLGLAPQFTPLLSPTFDILLLIVTSSSSSLSVSCKQPEGV
jgi:hypothetical protein